MVSPDDFKNDICLSPIDNKYNVNDQNINKNNIDIKNETNIKK
jgi:hypothetical protein